MGKSMLDNPVGGNFAPVHFHEDGGVFDFASASATPSYSGVFDLGNALSGIVVRAVAEEALTGESGTVELLVGADRDAALTGTAWSTAASFTGTAAVDSRLFSYTPQHDDTTKKYWAAKFTNVVGSVGVWNELIPGR